MPADGSTRWLAEAAGRATTYDDRWAEMAARGENVHGEADLVQRLAPPGGTVLDAGCGTGRVGAELARRGFEVVGVDLDPAMLERARERAPEVKWVLGDLASLSLDRRFDVVVLAGNVMIFLAPGTEGRVLATLAAHLVPGGLVVAGFQLEEGRLGLDAYDAHAAAAGLVLDQRWATWDGRPYQGGAYAVSVHRLPEA